MKLHRLLAITMLLLGRKRISGQELADQFEVSLRTIYRDLEAINEAGIPVISFAGADGGYEIMEQYRIDRQIVSLDELHSIVAALKGMQSSLDDRDMDRLLAKVGALVAKAEHNRQEETGETLLFDTNPWGGAEIKAVLSQLRQAAKNRNMTRFDYPNSDGTMTLRTVEPIGVAWKGYAWYLYAFCRLRSDYRTFKLSRIKGLAVDTDVFAKRDVRLEELAARWGQHMSTVARIEMVLRFHPRVRVRAEESFRSHRQQVEKDGSLLVTANLPEDPWLYGMLLSYGADLKVLEPKAVADKIRENAERIFRQYEYDTATEH